MMMMMRRRRRRRKRKRKKKKKMKRQRVLHERITRFFALATIVLKQPEKASRQRNMPAIDLALYFLLFFFLLLSPPFLPSLRL